MTVRQKVTIILALVLLLAVVVFCFWYLRRPEKIPKGTLVYSNQGEGRDVAEYNSISVL